MLVFQKKLEQCERRLAKKSSSAGRLGFMRNEIIIAEDFGIVSIN